ncbi:MAG: prolipoprotein diacylglyceryl transferase [Patescibacteria group bacterium]
MFEFFYNYIPQSTAFLFFGLSIKWYALFIVGGSLFGVLVVRLLQKKYNLYFEKFDDLLIWSALVGIIGARVYYVFYAWDYYRDNLLDILKIYKGGLGIWGAFVGIFLVTWIWCRKKNISFWFLADQLVILIIIGQIFGRWGNYFNQEVFGRPSVGVWRIPIELANRPIGYENFATFLPMFLFESCGNLLLLLLLLVLFNLIYRQQDSKWPSGVVFIFYLFSYSAFRFFLEFWRIDYSLTFLGLRTAQWVSLVFFVFSLLLCRLLIKRKQQ